MTITEGRFNSLAERVNNIAERVATLEGTNSAPDRPSYAVLIALLSILGTAVIGYWGWIGFEVVDHGKKLAEISALLSPQKLSQTAEGPIDGGSVANAAKILATAQQKNVQIPATVVAEVGVKFLDASTGTPQAWGLALQLASYRSDRINPALLPFLGTLRRAANTALYHTVLPGNVGELWEAGNASPENAALIQPLNEPNPFEHEAGAQFIVVQMRNKADFYLQPMHFKHYVLRNATVRYSGGKVWLEDVYFVDCGFIFEQTSVSRDLARQIVTSTPVNFKNL
jgi:hypothetical protein